MSGGETDETTDSYDTVDWLVRHIPHNNGRVGFAGCSYPGFYAMMGGLCGHPAVKAVSPQAPVTDWFMGDDVHHNGVLMLTDSYRFLSGMNTPPGRVPAAKMPSMSRQTQPDERTFFLEHTALAELTGLLKPNPFWEEMSAHPDYDAWWQERDLRRACYNVQPAVLVVGGTFDAEDCFGAWTLYRALNRQSPSTPCHLVVGPWAHGAWRNGGRTLGAFDFGSDASWEYYMEHFEVPFFDHYLRDGNTDEAAPLPAAAVFSSGDNRWHTFGRFLPREARKLTLYLADGGILDTRRPTAKTSASTYVSDPSDPVPYCEVSGLRRPKEYMVADQRFLFGRPDVLTFVSEPLEEDMTLVGPVDADLEVTLSTTDADFVVKLIDLFPEDFTLDLRVIVDLSVLFLPYRAFNSGIAVLADNRPMLGSLLALILRHKHERVEHTALGKLRPILHQLGTALKSLFRRRVIGRKNLRSIRCGYTDFLYFPNSANIHFVSSLPRFGIFRKYSQSGKPDSWILLLFALCSILLNTAPII